MQSAAARSMSMIANRAKTKPASADRADSARVRLLVRLSRHNTYRLGALAVALAGVILAAASPAVGRQESSSSSRPEAAQHENALAIAKQVKEDVNVGTFYMHKGDYGAAISRFKEAVRLDPKSVEARLRLAKSYEKQKNWSEALKTYRDYLRDFPKARDEKKIRKKIEELSRKGG